MLRAVEAAYDHFNARLFAGELPPALLNFSRSKGSQRVLGFFAPEAWAGKAGRVCELSLTPEATVRPTNDLYSTLVHEMAHFLERLVVDQVH